MMFPKNLDSVEEDLVKKKLEETQRERLEKPNKSLFWQLSNTLIAGVILIALLILFLWIINKFRY